MSGPTSTTTQQQNQDPWAGQQPYLLDAFKRSQNLLDSQNGTKPYAGLTPEQLDNYRNMIAYGSGAGGSGDALNWMQNARDSMYGIAGQNQKRATELNGYGDSLFNTGNSMLAGGAGQVGAGGNAISSAFNRLGNYTPTGGVGSNIAEAGQYANNPYMSGMVDAAMRDATRQATENDLPGIAREAAATGNIGSSSRGTAEGVVSRGLMDRAADVSSNLRGQAYESGLNRAEQGRQFNNNALLNAWQSSGQLGGTLGQLGLGQMGEGIGAIGQGANYNQNAQAARNAAGIALGQGQQMNQDYLGARAGLFDMVNQAGGGLQAGNQIDLNNLYQAPWDRLANYYGIVGGRNWGSQSTGTSSTTSSPGGLNILGGILGGLGSIGRMFPFSDERVKTDIKKVGELDNGLPVYSYRYKWGGPKQIGVMAQDAEKKRPNSVFFDEAGFRHVDYERAAA